MRIRSSVILALLIAPLALAHEGGKKDQKPTKAKADLERSRKKLAEAKKKLASEGRYSCCVKPSCDLCGLTNGSCNCAANVAAGRGACGECQGGWLAGRGSLKGIDAKSVGLLPADHQACPPSAAGASDVSAELREAIEALTAAKKTLVSEKRFACCIRGGCGQCAHEANCPCGADLASGKNGVCGDCGTSMCRTSHSGVRLCGLSRA